MLCSAFNKERLQEVLSRKTPLCFAVLSLATVLAGFAGMRLSHSINLSSLNSSINAAKNADRASNWHDAACYYKNACFYADITNQPAKLRYKLRLKLADRLYQSAQYAESVQAIGKDMALSDQIFAPYSSDLKECVSKQAAKDRYNCAADELLSADFAAMKRWQDSEKWLIEAMSFVPDDDQNRLQKLESRARKHFSKTSEPHKILQWLNEFEEFHRNQLKPANHLVLLRIKQLIEEMTEKRLQYKLNVSADCGTHRWLG